MGNQDRDREGNIGQPGKDAEKPAGTSGRPGNTGNDNWQQGTPDANRRPNRSDDDEDSGLGNRNTFR